VFVCVSVVCMCVSVGCMYVCVVCVCVCVCVWCVVHVYVCVLFVFFFISSMNAMHFPSQTFSNTNASLFPTCVFFIFYLLICLFNPPSHTYIHTTETHMHTTDTHTNIPQTQTHHTHTHIPHIPQKHISFHPFVIKYLARPIHRKLLIIYRSARQLLSIPEGISHLLYG